MHLVMGVTLISSDKALRVNVIMCKRVEIFLLFESKLPSGLVNIGGSQKLSNKELIK